MTDFNRGWLFLLRIVWRDGKGAIGTTFESIILLKFQFQLHVFSKNCVSCIPLHSFFMKIQSKDLKITIVLKEAATRGVFLPNDVPKNFAKFIEKYLCQSLFYRTHPDDCFSLLIHYSYISAKLQNSSICNS